MGWYGFRPYVPVARRRAKAAAYAVKLAKKEKRTLAPVQLSGRKIAGSFWGQAWCENLEQYSDYANRLPRGRTYVRNGSIIDLQIKTGLIEALVSGSEIYKVKIDIKTLPPALWRRLKEDCSRSINSLIDLLQGRFSEGVMGRLTQPKDGLFPKPSEISIKCSCPDWAYLCKHAAAVLYGIGARLDTAPEMLFTLRNVDHLELVSQAVAAESLDKTLAAGSTGLGDADLGEVFGIDLGGGQGVVAEPAAIPLTDVKSSGKAASTAKLPVKNGKRSNAKSKRAASVRRGAPAPGRRRAKKEFVFSS